LTAKQRDLVRERFGNAHLAAADPEGRIATLVGVIMEDDEVADALIIETDTAVIGVDIGGIEIAIREMREQLGDAVRDQGDASRFERFEEARNGGEERKRE